MKFSSTHEWGEINNDIVTVGITNFGRMHLGEVVNLTLPKIHEKVKANQEVCVVESNKAAVDVHSPVSGKIVETNNKILKDLEILNKSPEEEGWLFKVKVKNLDEFNKLMSLEEYEKKISK
ncbi:MAG: glycine cleavage system protein GcvH [Parachlamydiales bacterium]|nr:glycine cleavage system protein GcvH [Parachlamydiales bacterium]